MEFEWNPDKAKLNLEKHGVSFQEASTVFKDSLSITFPDPDHSVRENRCVIIGISQFGQLLVVAHTDRDEKVRIIQPVWELAGTVAALCKPVPKAASSS
jgi:hypothetical protein